MRSTIAVGIIVLFASPATASKRAVDTPVATPCVSSPFGPRLIPNHPQAGTYHNGVDLPAPEGAPVRSVAAGTLMKIQRHGPGGLEVLVQHHGFVGIYSHLASVTSQLEIGQYVSQGEQLGVVGRTGVTYGPHLFFGMLQSGHAVDPAPVLGLSLCKGMTMQPAQILERGGRLPATRHYLLLQGVLSHD